MQCVPENRTRVTKKKAPSAHLDLVVGTPPDDVTGLTGL